jgi:hypothetical protein
VAFANMAQSDARTGRLVGFKARLPGNCEIPPTLLSEAPHWMLHYPGKVSCCARRSSEGGSARSSRHRVRVSGATPQRDLKENTLGGKDVELPPIRNPCEP